MNYVSIYIYIKKTLNKKYHSTPFSSYSLTLSLYLFL